MNMCVYEYVFVTYTCAHVRIHVIQCISMAVVFSFLPLSLSLSLSFSLSPYTHLHEYTPFYGICNIIRVVKFFTFGNAI